MAPRISLALTLHNHQPIGNFDWVVADVCDRAYAPMVEALARHPTVRVGLHYSGSLLAWLERERPNLLDRIVELAGRGQVELLGGGLYEPILVSLPEADRREQLLRMADRIESLTGTRPRGAWLAERVWEPDLPRCLADTGYAWTILDDAHLRAAGLPEDAAWGSWITEDQGHRVEILATAQWLRYRIPFGTVAEVLDHMRAAATDDGERLATIGDDGEKFGAWPMTYEHCWGQARWVERFFDALEANATWLTTVTPTDWLREQTPRGLAYLPSTSYAEMGEWALPPDESRLFGEAVREAVETGRPESRWFRGAPWRAFLTKYREANDAHKQMLRASSAVHGMPSGEARDRALDDLHRGQSNDSYWHGLFGGLYLPDLRVAALGHLIAAQDAADATAGYAPTSIVEDLDADGRPDVLLADRGQVVTVDLDEGAGVGAWDVRAARHPVAAVLRRRPEAYHAKLGALEAEAGAGADPGVVARAEAAAGADAGTGTDAAAGTDVAAGTKKEAGEAPAGGGAHATPGTAGIRDTGPPPTIHELVAAKEAGLTSLLRYDHHERRLGLVRLLKSGVSPEATANGEADDLGDVVDAPYSIASLGQGRLVVVRDGHVVVDGRRLSVRVEKTIILGGDRRGPTLAFDVSVANRSDVAFAARVGLEIPTMLLGGGGNPQAWLEVKGRRWAHDSSGTAAGVDRLRQGNDHLGITIEASVSPPADAWWTPIETVSNSEAGFERVYQGSSLLLSWPCRLAAAEPFALTVQLVATTARDWMAEEGEQQPA